MAIWKPDVPIQRLLMAKFKKKPVEIERLRSDAVNHPVHYGGQDNPYEAIKVIEAWGLGFHLGNAVKYIARAGKKDAAVEDLHKARWYIDREIGRWVEKANEKDATQNAVLSRKW